MDFWSSTYDHRRSLDRSRGRLLDHRSLGRSIARSLGRSVARSLGRSVAQSLCRSVAPSFGRSVARSLARSLDRSIARSLDRSIARSLDRSIAWTECHLKNSTLSPITLLAFVLQDSQDGDGSVRSIFAFRCQECNEEGASKLAPARPPAIIENVCQKSYKMIELLFLARKMRYSPS